jgi:hypothetical protein
MVRHAAELVEGGYQGSSDPIRRDDVDLPGSLRRAMLRKENPESALRGKPHNGRVGVKMAHLLSAIKNHEDASDRVVGLGESELVDARSREGFTLLWRNARSIVPGLGEGLMREGQNGEPNHAECADLSRA